MVVNQGYKTLRDLTKILSLFNTFQAEERGISEISKSLEMQPSKISRMLRTLESEGFFERSPQTGKYRLGVGFFELGMAFAFHFPLTKIIRPHIEQMARELSLTASWAILRKSKIIVMDRVQNQNIDLLSQRVGLNLPIHSTSLGKVLLAYLPEEEQDRILKSTSFERFTSETIVDRKVIKKNLVTIKEKGFATDEGETHADLNCVAAPIKNASGEVIAAINLMGEKSHTSVEEVRRLSDYLREKAFFISRQIGFRDNF